MIYYQIAMVGKISQDTKKSWSILYQLRRLQTWHYVVILLIMIFVSATFLRLNNIGMIQRRDAVLSADEKNDNTETTKERLYALQRYTAAHMNTSTGVVYLQDSFDRDWAKIKKQAEESNKSNHANIYQKVENEVCGPLAKANGWRWPDPRYISCQRKELAKYSGGQTLINEVSPPDKELYRHSFLSPVWSPDFAGFSVAITLLVALIIATRCVVTLLLRIVLLFRN